MNKIIPEQPVASQSYKKLGNSKYRDYNKIKNDLFGPSDVEVGVILGIAGANNMSQRHSVDSDSD